MKEEKPTKSDDETKTTYVCRICYGGGDKEELRMPCKCLGSVRHIHSTCLFKWLRTGGGRCELCNTPYYFHRTLAKQRGVVHLSKWHFAHVVKELVVLDWFHFLETVVICISLLLINGVRSFDLMYQFSLIALVEVFYYTLNIAACCQLLYYERWSRLNIPRTVLDHVTTTTARDDVTTLPWRLRFMDCYTAFLSQNRKLRNVVDLINIEDDAMMQTAE